MKPFISDTIHFIKKNLFVKHFLADLSIFCKWGTRDSYQTIDLAHYRNRLQLSARSLVIISSE